MLDLSVVIPVFRSAASLEELMQRLTKTLSAGGWTFEVIFIDDGSRDDSWNMLLRLRTKYLQSLTAVQLTTNFGQHNALMCGFHHAQGRLVATMDDDLQHRPEDLPQLLSAIEATDADLVYGQYQVRRHNLLRQLSSTPALMMYRYVFGTRVSPTSFRVMRRHLAQGILFYDRAFAMVDGLLAWNTRRIVSVKVLHEPRRHGTSTYTWSKLFGLALDLCTNFSLLPLRLVWALGLMAVLVAVIGAVVGVWKAGDDEHAPYWLWSGMWLLGGAQLLSLGWIGEYIGRVHLNISRKPQYLERSVLKPPDGRLLNLAAGGSTESS